MSNLVTIEYGSTVKTNDKGWDHLEDNRLYRVERTVSLWEQWIEDLEEAGPEWEEEDELEPDSEYCVPVYDYGEAY